IEKILKRQPDTLQVRQLRELGYEIMESDSGLSKHLLTEALKKSLLLKDSDAITNSYRILGIWHNSFNYKDKALELYRASLTSATGNRHLYLVAGAYFNIGNIKYSKGEYDSCIIYYLKTNEIFEDPNIYKDKTITKRILDKKKSDLYYNMSAVFNTLKNLQKADEYIDKAIALAESYDNTIMVANYMQLKADNFYENGQTERALRIRLEYLP